MTPKKTAKAQPKYEEPIIPEGATTYEWNTTNNDVTVASNDLTVAKKSGVYVAYAPFDFDGEHYEPGEEFTPRKTWTRDVAFEEFRSVELKRGGTVGIAFL